MAGKDPASPLSIIEGGVASVVSVGTGNIGATQQNIKDVATNKNSLSNILPSLNNGAVMRIAEILIGILLIGVGVAKLASDSPVAKAVGKVGLL